MILLGCVLSSEDQARVYTAEIVSAVSHLHKCGIVHRDLKPENILMDADGHVMALPISHFCSRNMYEIRAICFSCINDLGFYA